MKKRDIQKKYCLIDSDLSPRNQIQIFGGYGLDEIKPDTHPKLYSAIRKNYRQLIHHLIHGLQIMHRNHIAHRDIKEFNMLGMMMSLPRKSTTKKQTINSKFEKKQKQNQKQSTISAISKPIIRYIDFGLSELINPDKDEGGINNFHWSGTDGYIPIEYIILYYMRDYVNVYGISAVKESTTKQRIIEKVYDRYKRKYMEFYDDIHIEQSLMSPTNHNPKFFSTTEISKIYDRLVDSLANRTFYKLQKTDYEGLVYKSDVFALGITLAYIRQHYRLQSDTKLKDLITQMIKISATDRPTSLECLKHPFFTHTTKKK
jgi:serine/threonine protein kinase